MPRSQKSAKKNTTLMDIYTKLQPHEQQILQLKGLLYRTASKTEFLNYVKSTSLRTDEDRMFQHPAMNIVLKKLHKLKLLDGDNNCLPAVLHFATKQALSGPNKEMNLKLLQHMSALTYKPRYAEDYYALADVRAFHLAVYMNNDKVFSELDFGETFWGAMFHLHNLYYSARFDKVWLQSRTPLIKTLLCFCKLSVYFEARKTIPDDFQDWLDFYPEISQHKLPGFLQYYKHQIDIHLGFFAAIAKDIKTATAVSPYLYASQGAWYFFNGKLDEAIASYETALKGFRKLFNKRSWFFEDMHAWIYLLSLIVKKYKLPTVAKIIMPKTRDGYANDQYLCLLKALLALAQNRREDAVTTVQQVQHYMSYSHAPFDLLDVGFLPCTAYWISSSDIDMGAKNISELFDRYQSLSPLVAYMLASYLSTQTDYVDIATNYINASPFKACKFIDLITVKEEWQYQLDQLTSLISKEAPREKASAKRRMIWLIDPDRLHIEVLEQKVNTKGEWTAGRAIALKRLHSHDAKLDYLTKQDWQAVEGLDVDYYGWYRSEEFSWKQEVTLPALIGHPCLFRRDNPELHLELVRAENELNIEADAGGYRLELSHHADSVGVTLEQESMHRYRVIAFSQDDVALSRLIGPKGLTVPEHAKESIMQLLQNPSTNIRISSELQGANLPTIEADAKCCAQLIPMNDGIKLNVWTRPFSSRPLLSSRRW